MHNILNIYLHTHQLLHLDTNPDPRGTFFLIYLCYTFSLTIGNILFFGTQMSFNFWT